MTKDILISVLSSLNILVFSFIGLNYDAFAKIANFQTTPTPSVFETYKISSLLLEKQLLNPELLIAQTNTAQELNTDKNTDTETDPHKTQLQTSWQGYIKIPKINLFAPLIYDPNTTSNSIQTALSQGTISLSKFSASTNTGQTIILGHSSDYPWNNNPYSTVFTLLPQLKEGDVIKIIKDRKAYQYIVKSSIITDQNLTGIKNESNPKNQLILSTCYPIGFYNKRFNIIATPKT